VILILAGLYAAMELEVGKRWAFPLMVVGMNSIAIYFMSWTMRTFLRQCALPPLRHGPFSDLRRAV